MEKGAVSGSDNTEVLELKSLQLDVLTLQRQREEDRRDFLEFTQNVAENFQKMQDNFSTIQANFAKFFSSRAEGGQAVASPDKEIPSGTGSNIPLLPRTNADNAQQQQAPVKGPRPQTAPPGSGRLFDHNGRELHLDSTPKLPYRHPNALYKPEDQVTHWGHHKEQHVPEEEPYDVNRVTKYKTPNMGEPRKNAPLVKVQHSRVWR
jgi:hypothetical protein